MEGVLVWEAEEVTLGEGDGEKVEAPPNPPPPPPLLPLLEALPVLEGEWVVDLEAPLIRDRVELAEEEWERVGRCPVGEVEGERLALTHTVTERV